MQRKNKYDEKLLRILDSACEIFAQKGYHNASVRDVASATGVSPAGLYYYFESKEELLHLILEACLAPLMDRIKEDICDIQDPALRLRAIVGAHLAHFDGHQKEMRVLVHEWQALTGPFGESIRRLMRDYARIVIRTFKELSPEKGSKELRASAFGLFGMLTWVDQWYSPGRDLPLDQLADRFAGFLLAGVAETTTPSARKKETKDKPDPAWSEGDSTSTILSGPGF